MSKNTPGGAKLPTSEEKNKNEVKPQEDRITLKKDDFDALMKRLDTLENQGTKLEAVADKGRLMDYEMKQAASEKKQIKVKIPVFGGGYIISHQVLRDRLIYGQMHGNPVGEEQEYEVSILLPDNSVIKQIIQTYGRFSSARYEERVEVPVISRREDRVGDIFYTVSLPDGREVEIGARFIN